MEGTKITERKQKAYTKTTLIFSNILVLAWIITGSIACGYIHPIIGWIFLILATFFIYFRLRKHCCKTCYYCKDCTLGFGKLPELFFLKNGTENVDKTGLKMYPLIYIVMTFVPTILLIISIFNQYQTIKILILILLIGFSTISGITRRKIINKMFKN